MLLLALDTSTSAATVALRDETRVLASSHVVDAQAHGEILAPGMQAVFREAGRRPADLTHVVVGVGPGPFTGLRVGIVSASTLAHVVGVAARGLCSLDALAHRAWTRGHRGRLLVATDARRKEVYARVYDLTEAGAEPQDDPGVVRPQDLPADIAALPCVGRGPVLYPDLLTPLAAGDPAFLDVDAVDLADLAVRRLSAGHDLLPTEPLYLRRPDAVPSAGAKSVLRR